jgi:glycosyltransferase involved in cell wall biosynthesis
VAPTVSVILPTYNRAGTYLRSSIESVLGVNYRDFELIVVDDGSTDDTAEVVRSYGDAVRYVRQENAGCAAAQNRGIAMAGGRYIAMQGDDDLYLPERFDEQVPLLDREPETGLVYGQVIMFWEDEGKEELWPTGEEMREGWVFPQLFFKDFIPIQTVLVRREVLDEVGGFDPSRPRSEDWDLLLRLTARYPVRCIPRVLFRHRRHGENKSGDYAKMLETHVSILEDALARNPGEVREIGPRALRFLGGKQARWARLLQKTGRGREAHRHYRRAIDLGERSPKTLLNWLRTAR